MLLQVTTHLTKALALCHTHTSCQETWSGLFTGLTLEVVVYTLTHYAVQRRFTFSHHNHKPATTCLNLTKHPDAVTQQTLMLWVKNKALISWPLINVLVKGSALMLLSAVHSNVTYTSSDWREQQGQTRSALDFLSRSTTNTQHQSNADTAKPETYEFTSFSWPCARADLITSHIWISEAVRGCMSTQTNIYPWLS